MNSIPDNSSKARVIIELCFILYVYYCLVMLFLIVPPIAFKFAGISLGLRPGTTISLAGVAIAELFAFFIAIKFYKRRGITVGNLGWNIPTNKTIAVFSLVVAVLYIWYTMQIPEIKENITEISLFKLWGLLVGILAAVIEEVIFRGFVMVRFQQARILPMVQVLLTAVAFSLLHLGFGLVGMLCTFAVGIALGALYVFGKRSLLGPILCHCVINATIEPWLLLWLLKFYAEKFSS